MTNNMTEEWQEMTEKAIDNWTETGTKVWRNWFDLISSTSSQAGVDLKPELDNVAQQFLDNRDLFTRFLKLSLKAWQDIFPKLNLEGGNWKETLEKYTNQLKEQFQQLSAPLKMTENANKLWEMYLKETQKMSQIWLEPFGSSLTTMTKAFMGDRSSWLELNNLYWNLLYEDSFGRFMKTPLLGPTREFNAQLLKGFEAWKDLYKSTNDYQIVLADLQVKSFEALIKELVDLNEKGNPVKDWREFQKVWSQVADQVFEEAFCQEGNLKIRGQFLNDLNAYRIQQQELMELYLKLMNLPNRTEVDEIHKEIYDLRKEVKQLKKDLAEAQNQSAQ